MALLVCEMVCLFVLGGLGAIISREKSCHSWTSRVRCTVWTPVLGEAVCMATQHGSSNLQNLIVRDGIVIIHNLKEKYILFFDCKLIEQIQYILIRVLSHSYWLNYAMNV